MKYNYCNNVRCEFDKFIASVKTFVDIFASSYVIHRSPVLNNVFMSQNLISSDSGY